MSGSMIRYAVVLGTPFSEIFEERMLHAQAAGSILANGQPTSALVVVDTRGLLLISMQCSWLLETA